jgi:hypothetical protein
MNMNCGRQCDPRGGGEGDEAFSAYPHDDDLRIPDKQRKFSKGCHQKLEALLRGIPTYVCHHGRTRGDPKSSPSLGTPIDRRWVKPGSVDAIADDRGPAVG